VFRPETQLLEENLKPTLLVAVTANDEIYVDGDVYELSQLRNVFEQLREENPRAEAMIQGDLGAPAGTVLDVQELLMDMEIPVKVSTEEG
jgi:biopolymer transport protein ExbD